MIEQLLFYGAFGLLGWVLGGLLDKLCLTLRAHVPYAPTVLDWFHYPFELYQHYFRFLIPDMLYKLWYQHGIMEKEAYRVAQEQGYIRDSLDPEHIQRYDE